jgi:hypothetical protein
MIVLKVLKDKQLNFVSTSRVMDIISAYTNFEDKQKNNNKK